MKVRWHTNMEAKNMQINLANTRLFRGMEPSDIEEILGCLHAKEHAFQKGEIIFPEGVATEQIGVVLSGRVIIEMGDVWGNNSVLSSIGPGGVFAEAYACVPLSPMPLLSMMIRRGYASAAAEYQARTGTLRQCLPAPCTACAEPADALLGEKFAALPPGAAHRPQVHSKAAAVLLFGVYQAHRQLFL